MPDPRLLGPRERMDVPRVVRSLRLGLLRARATPARTRQERDRATDVDHGRQITREPGRFHRAAPSRREDDRVSPMRTGRTPSTSRTRGPCADSRASSPSRSSAAPLTFAVVVNMLPRGARARETRRSTALHTPFVVVAAMLVFVATAIGTRMHGFGARLAERTRKTFLAHIAALALSEAATILGLVLVLITRSWDAVLPAALGFAGLATCAVRGEVRFGSLVTEAAETSGRARRVCWRPRRHAHEGRSRFPCCPRRGRRASSRKRASPPRRRRRGRRR